MKFTLKDYQRDAVRDALVNLKDARDDNSKAMPARFYDDSETCSGCKNQRGTLTSPMMWCGKARHWGTRCELYQRNITIQQGEYNAGS